MVQISGSNPDRKPPLSDILTEPLNPREANNSPSKNKKFLVLMLSVHLENTIKVLFISIYRLHLIL